MLEAILFWLAVAFVVVLIIAIAGYFALRWLFMRAAERVVAMVDRRVGGVTARAFTRLARFAEARGIGIDEAQRLFGIQIDRLARIMDSAVTIPILGRVGLDAVLDLIPVVGNFAGAAVSLTLIARALQVRPSARAGLQDAVKRTGRRHPRRDSARRAARRFMVPRQRSQCGLDA